jgi:hypothetical protein
MNAIAISNLGDLQPWFTATSDQKRFTFGCGEEASFNVCVDEFVYDEPPRGVCPEVPELAFGSWVSFVPSQDLHKYMLFAN